MNILTITIYFLPSPLCWVIELYDETLRPNVTVTSGDILMRTKLGPPVYYKKPLGNPRGGGQKIWRATTNATSQEVENGTIFGEMDRNTEKNMEANMEVSLLRLWALESGTGGRALLPHFHLERGAHRSGTDLECSLSVSLELLTRLERSGTIFAGTHWLYISNYQSLIAAYSTPPLLHAIRY